MAKAAKKAPAKKAAKAAPATESKSIVDPKYRVKKDPDWLGLLIQGVVSPITDKKVTVPDGEGGRKTITKKAPGDVDVKALFALAKENGVDVSKYKGQENSHGFAGRMRMTVRNMLQAVAKQRHGLYVGGTFKKAPAEWLEAKKAPESPTHTKDGEKIAKKPAKAA